MMLCRHFDVYMAFLCWLVRYKFEQCFYLRLCFKSGNSSRNFDRILPVFFIEVISRVNKLNHFLVLLCGVGFIFISGLAFLVLRIVEKYPLSDKTQWLLQVAVFLFLAILCILIFEWYSSEYIKILSES